MAVNQAAMRRRARIMRAVNVPMRAALNLADGRPARVRLRGRDAPARPELVTDPAELERLLGVIAEKNPRAARFIPIPRRADGRLDPGALDAALQHGFCIVRWHLAAQG